MLYITIPSAPHLSLTIYARLSSQLLRIWWKCMFLIKKNSFALSHAFESFENFNYLSKVINVLFINSRKKIWFSTFKRIVCVLTWLTNYSKHWLRTVEKYTWYERYRFYSGNKMYTTELIRFVKKAITVEKIKLMK